jgi:hypothetical protein
MMACELVRSVLISEPPEIGIEFGLSFLKGGVCVCVWCVCVVCVCARWRGRACVLCSAQCDLCRQETGVHTRQERP